MTAEQTEKLIPNCVGRLDPVMDAVRAEDWHKVDDLCRKERDRLDQQANQYEILSNQARQKANEVTNFANDLIFAENFRAGVLKEAGK